MRALQWRGRDIRLPSSKMGESYSSVVLSAVGQTTGYVVRLQLHRPYCFWRYLTFPVKLIRSRYTTLRRELGPPRYVHFFVRSTLSFWFQNCLCFQRFLGSH